ncbi:MAG: DUF3626 domain-containing protein [Pseudomonadota bacterium]
MTTMRCPFGCISEIPRRELLFPMIKCRQCHRRSASSAFGEMNESTSVAISTPNQALAYHNRMTTPSAQNSIDTAIMARIETLMGLTSKWYTRKSDRTNKIRNIYSAVIRCCMSAELTTNFDTKSLHLLLNSGAFKNMWHLGPDLEDEYTADRDKAEVMAFADYNKAIRDQNLLYADDSGHLDMRIKGDDRPGYMVLNVGNPIAGGAPMYGMSYVIYHDHVKMRATFTATDTVQMNKSQPISCDDAVSFGHLSQLLLKMSDAKLTELCKIATGTTASINRESDFIEAQSWGKISLSKDIRAFVIYMPDIERCRVAPNGHKMLPGPIKKTAPNSSARTEFFTFQLQRLRSFCAEKNIKLHFEHMQTGQYMSTLQPRPRLMAPAIL